MKIRSAFRGFTLIELLVVITIIAILAGVALPVFNTVQEKAQQNKCMQQAKGIGYGLKLFAGDHNGSFPSKKDEDGTNPGQITDANDALGNLVPTYVQTETPFGNNNSRYCKTAAGALVAPDNVTGNNRTLEAGENEYAYIMGLSETSNAAWPLIADGFTTGSETNPKYTNVVSDPGGVWSGKKAVVVRCDVSAEVMTVKQAGANAMMVTRRTTGADANYFQVSNSSSDPWISGCTVFNPRLP